VIAVLKPGLLTTVQDAGRPGHRASGLPVAGAMDRLAFALANALAGNPPGAAALEMTLLGGTFRFERPGYVGVCGADMQPRLNGTPVAPASGFPVLAGDLLAFGAARDGCRTYLSPAGGIDVAPLLGSRSTYVRGALGGFGGRALRAGDLLPVGPTPWARRRPRALAPGLVLPCGGAVTLRVLPGPQDDLFHSEGLATFFGAAYEVGNRNDRMGYQLEGPPIRHLRGPDIVSDALCPGAVQVPGSGRPIVMMADAQTTGGYAKIATVIGPDLRLLAQARIGDAVRFAACGEEEALEALRAERRSLAEATTAA
jgi:biotin-dependent carboxylase-like uncharacterized protein